jgi:hypothetical protein
MHAPHVRDDGLVVLFYSCTTKATFVVAYQSFTGPVPFNVVTVTGAVSPLDVTYQQAGVVEHLVADLALVLTPQVPGATL